MGLRTVTVVWVAMLLLLAAAAGPAADAAGATATATADPSQQFAEISALIAAGAPVREVRALLDMIAGRLQGELQRLLGDGRAGAAECDAEVARLSERVLAAERRAARVRDELLGHTNSGDVKNVAVRTAATDIARAQAALAAEGASVEEKQRLQREREAALQLKLRDNGELIGALRRLLNATAAAAAAPEEREAGREAVLAQLRALLPGEEQRQGEGGSADFKRATMADVQTVIKRMIAALRGDSAAVGQDLDAARSDWSRLSTAFEASLATQRQELQRLQALLARLEGEVAGHSAAARALQQELRDIERTADALRGERSEQRRTCEHTRLALQDDLRALREQLEMLRRLRATLDETDEYMGETLRARVAHVGLTYQWQPSAWSVCRPAAGNNGTDCGRQLRRRRLHCVTFGDAVVDDRLCADEGRALWPLTEECVSQPCPVDCWMGEWGPWSDCACDALAFDLRAKQYRLRPVRRAAAHGGQGCPAGAESRLCEQSPDCKQSSSSSSSSPSSSSPPPPPPPPPRRRTGNGTAAGKQAQQPLQPASSL